MREILSGYRIDSGAMQQQAQQFVQTIEANSAAARRAADARSIATIASAHEQMDLNAARFRASMQSAANAQDGIDRSTAGFVHYLNDTNVVENSVTGARTTVDANVAQAAATQDPAHFRLVPVSEYRKGVDF